jgi:hypothetical protein
MKKILFFTLFLALNAAVLNAQTAATAPAPKTYAFKNGLWYDGKTFVKGTWYVVNGQLKAKAPAKIDSIVDLEERWVVPPMGDVAASSISENPDPERMAAQYLKEGVFYVQIPSNTQEGRKNAEKSLNKPGQLDALFGNGILTCNLGHPFLKYEGPAQGVFNPQDWGKNYDKLASKRKLQGDAYWFVDNDDAFKADWERIRAQKPGVVSISLMDAQANGGKEGKGLSADMAKSVLKKAHKAGLKVFAYVENAEDLRLGLKLGVDGFYNMPGHNWDGSGDTQKFEPTDADLKKLAKKKTAVSLLFSHAQSSVPRPAVKEFHAKTLKRLLANGVQIVMGSDDPQRGIRSELNYLNGLRSEENAAVWLRILCENTPGAIFPNRKIGKIKDGYEASFLVLSDNPLGNILKIRAISFRVKNGVILR